MSPRSYEMEDFSERRSASISTASYDFPGQYPRQPELVLDTFDSASSVSSARYHGSFPSRHSIALYPSASTSTDFRVSHFATPPSTRRFSDIHGRAFHYPSMEELHLTGISSKANPPTKQSRATPHPSRRYGTHFGNPKKPVLQDIPSTATFSESDSEPEPSLYDISASDFPEPPPIGSPVIRRMRSSPWFLPEHGLDKDFSDVHHWRSRVPVDARSRSSTRFDSHHPEPLSMQTRRVSSLASARRASEDNESSGHMTRSSHDRTTKPLEHCEMIRTFDFNELSSSDLHLGRSTGNISSASGISDRTTSRPVRFSKDLPSTTDLNINSDRNDHGHGTVPGRQETRPLTLASLPRIIRKVASMSGQKAEVNGGHNFTAPSRSSQKTIPKARSFRSLLRSSEGNQAFKRNSHVEGAQNIWASASVPCDVDKGPTRSSVTLVQDSGHFEEASNRRRVWRHHLSSPVTGVGGSGTSDQELHATFAQDTMGPTRLASPFSYRAEQKSTYPQKMSVAQETPTATTKSFIDFTPDQGGKAKAGAKRERVKNIVARASNSFLGWGKRKTKSSAA